MVISFISGFVSQAAMIAAVEIMLYFSMSNEHPSMDEALTPRGPRSGEMATAQGAYSVPQRTDTPCTTSDRKCCTVALNL
jgi:hypothetical protein